MNEEMRKELEWYAKQINSELRNIQLLALFLYNEQYIENATKEMFDRAIRRIGGDIENVQKLLLDFYEEVE